MVLWIFGYGSLIWKTGFNYEERVVGFVKGYKRVFTQGSVDHRGTIDKPGRTVSLEPHEGAITWGAAYRLTDGVALSYLDVREQAYDLKAFLDVYTTDSPEKPAISGALTYIATSDIKKNVYYLGPAPLEDLARQIATAHGPSGYNYEYLFNLETSLLEIGVECLEEELVELSKEVRRLLKVSGDVNNHLTSSQISSPSMNGVVATI